MEIRGRVSAASEPDEERPIDLGHVDRHVRAAGNGHAVVAAMASAEMGMDQTAAGGGFCWWFLGTTTSWAEWQSRARKRPPQGINKR